MGSGGELFRLDMPIPPLPETQALARGRHIPTRDFRTATWLHAALSAESSLANPAPNVHQEKEHLSLTTTIMTR